MRVLVACASLAALADCSQVSIGLRPPVARHVSLTPPPTQDPHNWDAFNSRMAGVTVVNVDRVPRITINGSTWVDITHLSCGHIHVGDLSLPSSEDTHDVEFSVIASGVSLGCSLELSALLNIQPFDHTRVWGQDLVLNLTVSDDVEFRLRRESERKVPSRAALTKCDYELKVSLGCTQAANHSSDTLCDIIPIAQPILNQKIAEIANGPNGLLCNLTANATSLASKLLLVEDLALEYTDRAPTPAASPEVAESVFRDYVAETGDIVAKVGSGAYPVVSRILNATLNNVVNGSIAVDGIVDRIFPSGVPALPVGKTLSLWNVSFLDEVVRLNVTLEKVQIGGLDTFRRLSLFEPVGDYTVRSVVALSDLKIDLWFSTVLGPGKMVRGAPPTTVETARVSITVYDLLFDLSVMLGLSERGMRKATVYGMKSTADGCLFNSLTGRPSGVNITGLILKDSDWKLRVNSSADVGVSTLWREVGAVLADTYKLPLIQSLPYIIQDLVRPELNVGLELLIAEQQLMKQCKTPPPPPQPPAIGLAESLTALLSKARGAQSGALLRASGSSWVPPGWGRVNDLLAERALLIDYLQVPAMNITVQFLGQPTTIEIKSANLTNTTVQNLHIGTIAVADDAADPRSVPLKVRLDNVSVEVATSLDIDGDLLLPGLDPTPLTGHNAQVTINASVTLDVEIVLSRPTNDTTLLPTAANLTSCDFAISGFGIDCLPAEQSVCLGLVAGAPIIQQQIATLSKKVCEPDGYLQNATQKLNTYLPLLSGVLQSLSAPGIMPEPPSAQEAELQLHELPGGVDSLVSFDGLPRHIAELLSDLLSSAALDNHMVDMVFPGGVFSAPVDSSVSLWSVPLLDELVRVNLTLWNVTVAGLDTLTVLEPARPVAGGNFTFESRIGFKQLSVELWLKMEIGDGTHVLSRSGGKLPPVPALVRTDVVLYNASVAVNTTVGLSKEKFEELTLYGLTQKTLLCMLRPVVFHVDVPGLLRNETNITVGLNFSSFILGASDVTLQEKGLVAGGVDDLINGVSTAANDVAVPAVLQALPYLSQVVLRPAVDKAVAGVVAIAHSAVAASSDCLFRFPPPVTPPPAPEPPFPKLLTPAPTGAGAAAAPVLALAAAAAACLL
eukprot:TRINITY_DN618_c2_g1_i1.p1 TRINITY_DN618_c2_g1~~TRINITY_DN618_c2_g1_i1.p1  ORF type:complete len:1128 (+),score=317.45 TRINITY_DN618_c2_g1_i1:174-3557(+)